MSNTKNKLTWKQAHTLLCKFRSLTKIDELTETWIVAGSYRRLRPHVGDIEIVCIEKRVTVMKVPERRASQAASMLFKPQPEPTEVGAVWHALDQLRDAGTVVDPPTKCWGEKSRRFMYDGHQFDLSSATRDTWPVIVTIRTGPAELSHKMVMDRDHGGILPVGFRIGDGRLHVWEHDGWHLVDIASEEDLMEYFGGWVKPEERDAWLDRMKCRASGWYLARRQGVTA